MYVRFQCKMLRENLIMRGSKRKIRILGRPTEELFRQAVDRDEIFGHL